ncbi:NlpC/P60 family protein [Sulfurimonas sp. HSL-3221]|uniref:C40 family peptidase n=1 Tax=Sulfurimonadaceae TaxID=2771471 RepID=UPI001E2D2B6D|nr:NlpC/P60 family protein [Sulfurimonas sp. HSL-3221]UFS62252.1 NlpC/P60 family protein [Sulfurimonas sp. HSL-3221]
MMWDRVRQLGGLGIVAALLLGGCSTRYVDRRPSPPPVVHAADRTFAALPPMEEVWLLQEDEETAPAQQPVSQDPALAKLYPFQTKWHHVPYRYGGTGPRGIDCSAFVQQAYRELFGIRLPRTTRQQASCGSAVPKQQLQAGDLVFFRTSGRDRHVGIYLEAGKFMHVSTKYGVMISSMDKPYWKRHYWTTRRIR